MLQSPLNQKLDTSKGIRITICAPSRGQLIKKVLFAIYSNDKLIIQPDTTITSNMLGVVNPSYIKNINVLSGINAKNKYGDIAKNGVVEIYLDDVKYPEAAKIIKDNLTAKKNLK